MPRIFISYRRDDSKATAGRICDHLKKTFNNVFLDVDKVSNGTHFQNVIQKEVNKANVVLVIIGEDWFTAKHKKRLNDPEDLVRREIEMAFTRRIRIIPVLVDDAQLPAEAELPPSLRQLHRLHQAKIRNDSDFDHDMKSLTNQIKRPIFIWSLVLIISIVVFVGLVLWANNRETLTPLFFNNPPNGVLEGTSVANFTEIVSDPLKLTYEYSITLTRDAHIIQQTQDVIATKTQSAFLTELVSNVQTQVVQTATAIVETWTQTPSASIEFTETPLPITTSTSTPTNTLTPTPSATATQTETLSPGQELATNQALASIVPTATPQITISVGNGTKITQQYLLVGYTAAVTSIAFNSSGTLLAGAANDGNVWIWDLQTATEPLSPPISVSNPIIVGNHGPIWSMTFDPTDIWLAIGSYDGSIMVANTVNWQTQVLPGHSGPVTQVVFTPDGTLISVSKDKSIIQWNITDGTSIPVRNLDAGILSIALSPDDIFIATGDEYGNVQLRDINSLQVIATMQRPNASQATQGYLSHNGWVETVAFSPDGEILASGGSDQIVRLWDVRTGSYMQEFNIGSSVKSISFNPNGTLLAIGSDDGILRIFNVETLQQVGSDLAGHGSKIWAVQFSPEGTFIASGGNNDVRLWGIP